MKQQNSKTKKTLLSSVIVLIVCVAMLLGTTFAWFTDSVSNTGNRIQAGTLKIDLLKKQSDGSFESIAGSTTPAFNYDKWEPGYSDGGVFEIKNNGNLALKYVLSISISSGTLETFEVNGEQKSLADVIDVYYKEYSSKEDTDNYPTDFASAKTTMTKIGTLAEVLAAGTKLAHGVLLPANSTTTDVPAAYLAETKVGSAYAGVVLHMQEDAGNEYQDKSIGATFDITLNATQFTYEKDGFDSNLYDKMADLPVSGSATFSPVTEEVSADQTVVTTGAIQSATVAAAGVNGVFNDMKSTTATDSNSLVMTLSVIKTNEKKEELEGGDIRKTVDLDINMKAVMTKTPTEGTPVVDEKNIESLAGYTDIEYIIGAGLQNVKASHKGNEMATSAAGDTSGYGWYEYDSTSGIITFHTKTFSPFAVTYDVPGPEVVVAANTDLTKILAKMTLAEFRDSVNAGNGQFGLYAGYTVTLLKNVDLKNAVWTEIGNSGRKQAGKAFAGIFDGNGKTISNINCTSDVDDMCAGLFGTINNSTIKNLTISGGTVTNTVDTAGAVVGCTLGESVLDNCHSKNVTVIAGDAGGGIAGRIYGKTNSTVKNCSSSSTVSSGGKAGGIMAICEINVSVLKCSNSGNINTGTMGEGKPYGVIGGLGGICGYSNPNVSFTECSNTGSIGDIYSRYTGGIIGINSGTDKSLSIQISSCTNGGAVNSFFASGGMVGFAMTPVVLSASENTGTIDATYPVRSKTDQAGVPYPAAGGMIGKVDTGITVSIGTCTNYGTIKADAQHNETGQYKSYAGGLVGFEVTNNTVTLTECSGGNIENITATGKSTTEAYKGVDVASRETKVVIP